MSYLDNTPFSLVETDSETGKPLSPEAIENRKRLILLWKIQAEEQRAMECDLLDPNCATEAALTGEEFLNLLRSLMQWGISAMKMPALKMEVLEQMSQIKFSDTDPSSLN